MALLLLAICLVAVVRIRLLTTPLERDEGEFAYAGQLILQGIPPYQLFYNMKLPGIYAAYACIMGLFGQTEAGIHFGLLLVNLAAILLLYRLALRLLDQAGAVAAAVAYTVLSTSPIVLGLSAHATQFVVAAALGGLLLLLRAQESGKAGQFFAGGVLLGLAFLMKQPGAIFGLFGLALLIVRGAQEKEQWGIHFRRIAWFLAGLATLPALTALILWRAGVFDRFWFWTVIYARQHANQIPWSQGRILLAYFFRPMSLLGDGLLWLAAGLGLATVILSKKEPPSKLWMVYFLLFSVVAVSVSNYFSSHYFVMLLPALCLLAGQALSAVLQWARSRAPGKAWAAWPVGVFAAICVLVVFHHRQIFFVLSPEQICLQEYGRNPFIECRQIGHYLDEHAAPGARIAVLGSEPETFFYARRHSATGYIYMYDMTASQPFAKDMQLEMIAQIEAAKPEYLLLVHNPLSWDTRLDFENFKRTAIKSWMPGFTHDFYEPAGLVLIKDPSPEYFWGKDAMNRPEFNGSFISVFKRK